MTETLNGEYELQLTHPIDEAGKWKRLVEGCILRAPVPASMTPRVELAAQEASGGRMIYRVTTNRDPLRLRSGTGTNYKILGKYAKGSRVYVLSKTTSSWYEVTAPDGKHGYMASQYLTYVSTEPPSSPAVSGGVVEPKQLRDQPFRIYRVVPELDKISVYARHVFYDLMDNMIREYKPSSSAAGAAVVQGLSSACLSEHSFAGATGTIATDVGDSVNWMPPVSLAASIPNATSGVCTITCYTYYSGTLTGTATCTLTLTVPDNIKPSLSFSFGEAVSGIYAQFGTYVRTRSKLSVSITSSGSQGSTITSYRTSVNGTTYTTATFTTGTLNTAGENTISVTVTDSRGRSTTISNTFNVAAYSPPSLTRFSAERCNSAGTAAQTDGNKVRVSLAGSVTSVNDRNVISCKVYYKLPSATAWTEALTVTASNFAVSETNRPLSQTFDVLSSYDLKVRLQDYFYYVEQTVSIGTKTVIMDFLSNGNGIAFGKVAENSGYVEFGWPLILSSALGVAYGGTGATTAAGAIANLGGVKKTGDTMTGNLTIQSALYPSVYLTPTYNSTTNRTVFEGSYLGASSFAAWEDSTGSNRRMLEVRTASYAPSMDNAVLLRTAVNNSYYSYRVFHAGMATPVPIANGGTGASVAKAALTNLGVFYSATLPSSGTDGQICLVPV